jgi:peptide deformylase
MAVRKIEMLGSEVLRRRAEEIDAPDAELDRLIDDMFQTMYDAQGIGLAGPQVGVSRRVIVVDTGEDGAKPLAMLNPVIVESAKEEEKAEEGCLSIPGVSGLVTRPASVVVEGQDRTGAPVRIEASGILARCLQHEVDHLEGVLFIDRLSPLKRNMLLRKWKKLTA